MSSIFSSFLFILSVPNYKIKVYTVHTFTDEISVENKQARQVSQSDTCHPRFDIESNLIILMFTGPFF